ncbi:MAG: Transcription elongation factor NusA [Candidatus Methanohalarchaeum thermophilum]|uniref:Probable transcription termination protein NusA n=1 Tax=Methanohalarchaeum thermophilum TaxID=1903181 RepID=A0A1Q6DRZ7_METT1|nr:MAG: Transcription elongation factor NusA [Candidatus Methanohalarchaeum thermophilum]
MSEVKLSSEEIRYIALFESLTNAGAKDCLVDQENSRVIFVVSEGEMGLAIGKDGSNINKVKNTIGKKVEVVEYSEKPRRFIENSLSPADIQEIEVKDRGEEKIATVNVDENKKGLVIGKNGKNIEKAKLLAKRHYDIDDIIIN